MTYQCWNKGVLLEEPLNAWLTAECITSSVDVIACFLDSGSEIVIVTSKMCSARIGINCSSEIAEVFFLDCASWTWTPSHVTDCCNQDPVRLE